MKSFFVAVGLVIGLMILNSWGYVASRDLNVPILNRNPDAHMNQNCVAEAQNQLSPQWGDASTLQRTMAVLEVIVTCEEK